MTAWSGAKIEQQKLVSQDAKTQAPQAEDQPRYGANGMYYRVRPTP
jgi:hypothetical protein